MLGFRQQKSMCKGLEVYRYEGTREPPMQPEHNR
jgi:hypothetical protein